MSELLKQFIEGYDDVKVEQSKEKDYWTEIIRAEQNKLIIQSELEAIETHYDMPCAVVYMGYTKGVIPVYEFGAAAEKYVRTKEDCSDKEKMKNTYTLMRSLIGQKIAYIVKGHDKKANIFMASRKEALEIMRKKTEEKIADGEKVVGVVRNVNPYRALLDIGGVIAVLPSSEYRHGWTDDLTEHIAPGDHIEVMILKFDKEKGRAVVSRKPIIPDPWENLEIFKKSEYHAEITGVRENGCYFRIKTKGGYVDGFLKHPRHELLQRGDKALVRILNIDEKRKRVFGLYIRPVSA